MKDLSALQKVEDNQQHQKRLSSLPGIVDRFILSSIRLLLGSTYFKYFQTPIIATQTGVYLRHQFILQFRWENPSEFRIPPTPRPTSFPEAVMPKNLIDSMHNIIWERLRVLIESCLGPRIQGNGNIQVVLLDRANFYAEKYTCV
uniref:Uncharacterized protein n=1 Tax=Steinernema glaseri TaxID=37863 RepID=A0A1I7ZT92_9BILA